jgi:release factor glutamine methyltransferase
MSIRQIFSQVLRKTSNKVPSSVQQALGIADSLKNVSDSFQLDTELLLAHVLDKSREYLRAHNEETISSENLERFSRLIERRKQGEPVAYILGHKEFWDFDLKVNSSVLVPRPETEQLVEKCLEKLEKLKDRSDNDSIRVADLGTGSGAIAIALARANSSWEVHAVDISEDALEVALDNATALGAGNIEFHCGSWCDGLPVEKFDLIVANPPYVEPGDEHLEKGDLPFEPSVALLADDSGFSALDQIMTDARKYLKKDAWLLMEHGYSQQQQLLLNLEALGYSEITGCKDYASVDRMVLARWE